MEFAAAQEVDNRIRDVVRTYPIDVDALIERSKAERRLARRRVRGMAIAASVAALGLSVAAISALQPTRGAYVAGEQRQEFELEDGSVVALNAHSEVRAAFSAEARDLYLEKGQGFFRVRQDAHRPLRVHAGLAMVVAVGTEFDVSVARDQTVTAVVVKGVVQAKPQLAPPKTPRPVQAVTLSAGQSVTIHQDGRIEPVKKVDATAATAWWQPEQQLVFDRWPLAEVAKEFNRYNAAPKLIVEGAELRRLPVSGVFWKTRPESLLNVLKLNKTIKIVRNGEDITLRDSGP
ncbi:FecR family protein [Steroidobacter flavus]|uniref:FecR family protein n=1 Tax=Steroidobacter flavus TaxID=1842136 RepID=A0ABV8SNM4_9GAMM